MTQTHIKNTFQPITDDIDQKINEMARAKGIPKLTTDPPVQASILPDQPPAQALAPRHSARVSIPEYAWTEILTLIAKERVTSNYFILRALRNAGITIHDVDMEEDGRRRSNKAKAKRTLQ